MAMGYGAGEGAGGAEAASKACVPSEPRPSTKRRKLPPDWPLLWAQTASQAAPPPPPLSPALPTSDSCPPCPPRNPPPPPVSQVRRPEEPPHHQLQVLLRRHALHERENLPAFARPHESACLGDSQPRLCAACITGTSALGVGESWRARPPALPRLPANPNSIPTHHCFPPTATPQGNTAVYQLYAHARITSIVRKSGEAHCLAACLAARGAAARKLAGLRRRGRGGARGVLITNILVDVLFCLTCPV